MYALKEIKDGYPLFYCDTVNDIENLPRAKSKGSNGEFCPPFSEAFVIADSSVYILRGDIDEWVMPG